MIINFHHDLMTIKTMFRRRLMNGIHKTFNVVFYNYSTIFFLLFTILYFAGTILSLKLMKWIFEV